jgi:ABC-type polar amino acid transport system ATPase subunit
VIEVENLSAERSGQPVLRDVSLSVAPGAVTVLVGPSGGGKSTLLRCLTGLAEFSAGSVLIAGHRLDAGPQPVATLQAVRRDVGMVFQQFNLFPHLTALDNVMLAPRVVLGLLPAAARRQATDLLARVGLDEHAGKRPSQLSGGQQQRVAIARALAMQPKVMLFDEPTSSLDPAMTGEVLAVVAELARSGQTMVIVTHDHGFARRAATEVVQLAAGRVVARGAAGDLL